MKNEQTTPATAFLNVQVTAIPYVDKKDHKVKYETTFDPPNLTITEPDTVINYQLVAPTPDDVKFKKLTVKPDQGNQFSKPSIGESGKIVTFSDANTVQATFNISLDFTNKDNVIFTVDPEVINDPQKPHAEVMALMENDPEPINDPHR